MGRIILTESSKSQPTAEQLFGYEQVAKRIANIRFDKQKKPYGCDTKTLPYGFWFFLSISSRFSASLSLLS